MAAYASVASLMNTIEDILSHPLHSFSIDRKQLESLHVIFSFLLDFIKTYNPHNGSEEEEALDSLIASTAHAVEDGIEYHAASEILLEFKGRKQLKDEQPSNSVPTTTSKPLSLGPAKNDMVGFEDELSQLKDRLTGYQSNLQIVPIVGMGGIGKTTLATNVYEDSLIVQHFEIRAWVTISQDYILKKILSELLSCMVNIEIKKSSEKFASETDQVTEDQLGLRVYQNLSGRRYLIVLDDVWSFEIWDKLKFYFPDLGSRSRVVITSRISNVAAHLSSSLLDMDMKLLDEDKCWKLFCREVFVGESCPPELEEVGKAVVTQCKGLPLSIVVIGGLLRSSQGTREYWESLARDINSFLLLGNGHCLDILSLSYYHLPAHLKPCFLHMGVFPEDEIISISLLAKNFIAEGYVRPNKGQSLEDSAEDNIRDLINKNLIFVHRRRWTGRTKYIMLHDLVREVCLRIPEKDEFFYTMRVLDIQPNIHGERQIVHHYIVHQVFSSPPSTDAFKCINGPLPFKTRNLRVFCQVNFDAIEEVFQQVNLRYIIYHVSKSLKPEEIPSKLPPSISLPWNLQTLIISGFTI